MAMALMLHLLSAVVWVGGMFFAYVVLRPVASRLLDAPVRLTLWSRVFSSFFPWVGFAIFTLLLTGYGMIFQIFGGMATTPIYVHVMQGLGLIMMLIFGHVFFVPTRRLRRAVETQDWETAGRQLGQIRMLIGVNLSLGLGVIAIAGAGRMGM